MAADASQPRSGAVAFERRLPPPTRVLALLLPALLVASLLIAHAPVLLRPLPGVGVEDLAPTELTDTAAATLEDRTRSGGGGYRFEIIQTSTMVAKPGGPRIPVPDATGRGTARLADRYFLHSIIEAGVVRPEGFWSQMRAGPTEGTAPDWTGAPIMFEALVRDGVRWRDDGEGWYRADALPGVGLDPETVAVLPRLLRAADPSDLPATDDRADPDAARSVESPAKVVDIPGVIAADGASFTELLESIAYGFDDAGRLISIDTVARNTNMTDVDLVIATVITIAYDDVDGLPDPARRLLAAQ